jgi:hypothetical protein
MSKQSKSTEDLNNIQNTDIPNKIEKMEEIFNEAMSVLSVTGTNKMAKVIQGQKINLNSSDTRKQKPETYTQEFFIIPMLKDILDYEGNFISQYQIKKASGSFRYPDLKIELKDLDILLESEPIDVDLNQKGHGIPQVMEWLGQISVSEDIGIASNGIRWVLIYRDRKKNTVRKVEEVSLSETFGFLFTKQQKIKQLPSDENDRQKLMREELNKFYLVFSPERIKERIIENVDLLDRRREAVTKKFYNEFMEIVFGTSNNNISQNIVKSGYYLVNKIIPPNNVIDERTKEKFSILFMNRLLFIKFLEEKDLVDRELLTTLIKKYETNTPPNSFYKAYLAPLFYEVFNKQERDRITPDETYRKIPYLNGGLFRQNIENEEKYNIDNKIVIEIINFIEKYQFRLEQKGSKDELNPDIIGFIYEKVINRITNGKRKEQGAYYTPEDVTVNISKSTIYSYLLKKIKEMLRKDYEWNDAQLRKYTNLEQLLDIKQRFTNDNGMWRSILKIVKEIKIIDPACGSGHFLITVLNVLTQIHKTIFTCMGETSDNEFKLKYEIITNNLFGSDIDPIAVEISRLRLWLSLIGSMEVGKEKQTEKLPNIEYNVINGNSLLGITNIKEIKSGTIDGDTLNETEEDLRQTEELIQKYKTESDPVKSEEMRNELRTKYKKLELLADRVYLKGKIENVGTPLLHWPIEFIDVFASENSGFDVIIGNPPYGNILKDKEKEFVGRYSKSIDEIAGSFIDRMIPLSSVGANLGFIVTYAITFNKDLSNTRHNLITEYEKTTILTFDRDRCRIFSEMSQSVSFLFCENKCKGNNGKMYTSQFYRDIPDNFDCPVENVDGLTFFEKSSSLSTLTGKHRIPKIGSQKNREILISLKSNPDVLNKIIARNNGRNAWYRSSGNYWYNAWDFEPYTSSEIKKINIEEEYYNLFLVIMNSSLFYFYFRVYGDGRHMNSDLMQSFPIPGEKFIEEYNEELSHCSNNIMRALKENFDAKRNRFLTSKAKRSIDECDKLLAKMYGFTQDQVDYLINYDKEIRGETDDENENLHI